MPKGIRHTPEHWNPGVRFGLGLTIMTASLPGLFPGLSSWVWGAGVILGFVVMAHSALPFFREARRNKIHVAIVSAIPLVVLSAAHWWPTAATTPVTGSQFDKNNTTQKFLTMHQIFELDYKNFHSMSFGIDIHERGSDMVVTAPVRLLFDFGSKTRFLSVFLTNKESASLIIQFAIDSPEKIIAGFDKNWSVESTTPGESISLETSSLTFTKLIVFYSDWDLPLQIQADFERAGKAKGLSIAFRGVAYHSLRWHDVDLLKLADERAKARPVPWSQSQARSAQPP